MTCYIYSISSPEYDYEYVGSTVNPFKRLKDHKTHGTSAYELANASDCFMDILETTTEDLRYQKEGEWYHKLTARGIRLCNKVVPGRKAKERKEHIKKEKLLNQYKSRNEYYYNSNNNKSKCKMCGAIHSARVMRKHKGSQECKDTVALCESIQ